MKRRTQQYGRYTFTFKTRTLSMDPSKCLPKIFDMIIERLVEQGIFPQNSDFFLTINEYEPGQGIMPHVDANVKLIFKLRKYTTLNMRI
jgi:alkylated DNA repair dioxygenase AlkB